MHRRPNRDKFTEENRDRHRDSSTENSVLAVPRRRLATQRHRLAHARPQSGRSRHTRRWWLTSMKPDASWTFARGWSGERLRREAVVSSPCPAGWRGTRCLVGWSSEWCKASFCSTCARVCFVCICVCVHTADCHYPSTVYNTYSG